MKPDYLKEKKKLFSVVLLCISAFLAIMILAKINGLFESSAKAEKIVTSAIEQNTEDTNDIKKYFTEYKKLADALKKNNLFAPPPPRQNPVSEISGIFGDEVIIGDRLYKVGDKVGDARIVAIAPTEVTIEWDGQKKTFSPIDSGGSSGPEGPGGPRDSASGGPPRASGGSAQMVTVQSQGGPTGDPVGGMGGFGGPRGFMSDAERRERMERFRNMPEAERQAAIERFRNEIRERMMGGGRFPGGDRGSGSERRRGR